MISFQDLMKGFGVATVMNACIYKLAPGVSYNGKAGCVHRINGGALTPFDFECTHLYIDTLKIANLTQEGPTKTITGGQYANPLLKYGKTMTLEMQNALGSAEVLKTFFGCNYDEDNGVLSVTDKFPSPFAIEGETFFIDQKTGQKKKVWIFIPYFIPDGIFNLTQDAESDAAVFDCNGTVGIAKIKDSKHPNGHDIFYHIADKPWLRFGYMITPDTILNYVLDSDTDSYAIDGLKVSAYNGDIIIPALHNGKRVTSIAADAFTKDGGRNENINIKNIYIPNTVTHIYDGAFYQHNSLQKVVFGGSSRLRYIGDQAFCDTNNLQSLHIPDAVRFIGVCAFFNSGVAVYKGKFYRPSFGGDDQYCFYYVDDWCVHASSIFDDIRTIVDGTIGIASQAIPEHMYGTESIPDTVKYINPQNLTVAHQAVDLIQDPEFNEDYYTGYFISSRTNEYYCLIWLDNFYHSDYGAMIQSALNKNCKIIAGVLEDTSSTGGKVTIDISDTQCEFISAQSIDIKSSNYEPNRPSYEIIVPWTKQESLNMGAPWFIIPTDGYFKIEIICTDGTIIIQR